MTHVFVGTLDIPMADIGPASPHAPLREISDLHTTAVLAPEIPDEIRRNAKFGKVGTILPYHPYDDYGRERVRRSVPAAVIENEHLRATFLTSLGGRLWSLIDRKSGRELLYQSPVIQPVNLGLGNAWFCGGVEWNISTIGHSPLSCEPIHAVRVVTPAGEARLRLYGYERLRATPYRIDAVLSADSRALLLDIRIDNPNRGTVPVYWWSNIAVPEGPGVRVLVPADEAFQFNYHGLSRIPIPIVGGCDVTYPSNGEFSVDYFFDVAAKARPWIAAVDEQGRGMFQTSTAEMRGRKMFIWGQGPGGQHWQSFLSKPGHPYLEIQGGLAQTQLEHLELPSGASMRWVEAYGSVELESAIAHGPWTQSREAAQRRIDDLAPTSVLADLQRSPDDQPATEVLHVGTGWGTLEDVRRACAGEPRLATPSTPWPAEALGPEQAPWKTLIDAGRLPDLDPQTEPPRSVVGDDWSRRLQLAPASWVTHYLLGITALASGNRERARQEWARSLHSADNPWAHRALATLDDEPSVAADRLTRAAAMRPDDRLLVVELIGALIRSGRAGDALALIDGLSASMRQHGRVRLLEARAATEADDLERALGILTGGLVVPDLREGDTVLEELWYDVQARLLARREGVPVGPSIRDRARRRFPVPPDLEFRMTPIGGTSGSASAHLQ
jgi:hypothetical protein